jgi:hypothetical protein
VNIKAIHGLSRRTITSTFLLTLHRECALTIFLTVALGYNFCPGAMMGMDRLTEAQVICARRGFRVLLPRAQKYVGASVVPPEGALTMQQHANSPQRHTKLTVLNMGFAELRIINTSLQSIPMLGHGVLHEPLYVTVL